MNKQKLITISVIIWILVASALFYSLNNTIKETRESRERYYVKLESAQMIILADPSNTTIAFIELNLTHANITWWNVILQNTSIKYNKNKTAVYLGNYDKSISILNYKLDLVIIEQTNLIYRKWDTYHAIFTVKRTW